MVGLAHKNGTSLVGDSSVWQLDIDGWKWRQVVWLELKYLFSPWSDYGLHLMWIEAPTVLGQQSASQASIIPCFSHQICFSIIIDFNHQIEYHQIFFSGVFQSSDKFFQPSDDIFLSSDASIIGCFNHQMLQSSDAAINGFFLHTTVTTFIWWLIFMLATNIQYKYIYSKMYISRPCAQRVHRILPNWHIFPKCWQLFSNTSKHYKIVHSEIHI